MTLMAFWGNMPFSGDDARFLITFCSIGPVDLTTGTVQETDSVPTVTDNLFAQGTIATESIGISFVPTTSSQSAANGELDFGGVDSSKYASLHASCKPCSKLNNALAQDHWRRFIRSDHEHIAGEQLLGH